MIFDERKQMSINNPLPIEEDINLVDKTVLLFSWDKAQTPLH